MSSSSNENAPATAVTDEVKALLLEKLKELRDPSSPPRYESLDTIGEHISNGAFSGDLMVSTEAIETILDATKHQSVGVDFLKCASLVFSCLLKFNNSEITGHFIDKGGVDRCLEIVESFQTNGVVVHAYSVFLAVMLESVEGEKRSSVTTRIFETLLPAMELLQDDAIPFGWAAEALGRCLVPTVELDPDLSQRATQCAFDGIVLHSHCREVRDSGSRLLKLTAGTEAATKMLKNVNTKGPFVSREVTIMLQMLTMELRCPASDEDEQEALEDEQEALDTICGLGIADETNDNEAFKELLVSMKAMETIIALMERSSASPRSLHKAGGIAVQLIMLSAERSTRFIDLGGIDASLGIMKTHVSDSFLMKTYTGLIRFLLWSVTDEQLDSFARRIFEAIVPIMQHHPEVDAGLYYMECEALLRCFPRPGLEISLEVFSEAVQCTCAGIVFHKHDEEAQGSGRHLLVHLLGPDAASELIGRVEIDHCQDAGCSCAA